jgi:3-deoxy-manno-octulosonate cytidylyltransferase (CMP-KDO synthetase)
MVTLNIIGSFNPTAQCRGGKTMGECSKQQPVKKSGGEGAKLFIAIPARLSSTRLPEKPLQNLAGKSMIARVTERALCFARQVKNKYGFAEAHVIVATDDPRIAKCAQEEGAVATLTSPHLQSGTDRIFAALESQGLAPNDLVINIQGDEPFFSFDDVASLVGTMLSKPEVPMGTLAFERTSREHFFKSSVVKVVRSQSGRAIYFSRAPAPWPRSELGASGTEWMTKSTQDVLREPFLHHMGVYAFRYEALRVFARELPPSPLEVKEGLEQLRAVEAGWHIALVTAKEEPFGIDTPEDLAIAVQKLTKRI